MATPIWVGGTSRDWNTDANWSTAAKPANGDTAIIDGTVDIDGYDASGVNLAALIIRETYTGQFGTSSANPLKVACAGECSVLGGSAVYLNSGASNPIVNLFVKMKTPQTIFDIGGTVTYGEILRGRPISAASFTALALQGFENNALNLTQPTFNGGTIASAKFHYTDLWIMAATTFTAMRHKFGVCWNYAGTLTAANIEIGAVLKQYHTATSTTIEVEPGGFLDGSVDRRTKTITNLILHEGGNADVGNITLTNGVKKPSRLAATNYGARP